MSRRICKACGKEFLKGARALVIGPPKSSYAVVCQRCASAGALLVPVIQPTIVRNVEASSSDLKEGVRRLESILKAATLVEPRGDDAARAHRQGRIEGLESAIEVLRKIGAPS